MDDPFSPLKPKNMLAELLSPKNLRADARNIEPFR
jgi:hypothetical protein